MTGFCYNSLDRVKGTRLMALKIRAVYQDGQIKLLDPVELHEGQQMTINVEPVSEDEAIRAALGDSVQ
jgi:predicted DNA-binding antitoxin AbrB/MazE fold protein